MPVAQRESRPAVVEAGPGPGGGLVATRAVRAELSAVRVVVPVTVCTARCRLAVLPAGLVAGAAVGSGVRAVQGEIRSRVIERGSDEFDDVGVPPEVLGVTGLALQAFDALQPAVEASIPASVGGDVLVAVHAQRRLPLAIGPVVALRAVRPHLGMPGNHLAGHEQGLDPGRMRPLPRHDRSQHDQSAEQ